MHTHSRLADYGREYEGVILPMDKELPAWSKDGEYYVQGIRTTFERRDADLCSLLWITPSGQYKARSGAETDIAYVRRVRVDDTRSLQLLYPALTVFLS